VVIGLIGACWRLAAVGTTPATARARGRPIATYLGADEPPSTNPMLPAGG
jgi:hypothetical protein